MKIEIKKINSSKSLLNRRWGLKYFDERDAIYLSQKNKLNYIVAKLLSIRKINEDKVARFLNPDINHDIPNPSKLKDIELASKRLIEAIEKKQKIGIIADYDVDGSTSACILYKFLRNFTSSIIIKIPNRLKDGYGPNIKIMNETENNNDKKEAVTNKEFTSKKIGRNEPCPCGSGKKYKHCCGKL